MNRLNTSTIYVTVQVQIYSTKVNITDFDDLSLAQLVLSNSSNLFSKSDTSLA